MGAAERVTVTLPADVVDEIERLEKNRSKFVLEAVKDLLQKRRHEALLRSLHEPHPEIAHLSDSGIAEWADSLPVEDCGALVDLDAGQKVRWVPGEGWSEVER